MKRSVAFVAITYVAAVALTLTAQQASGAKPLDGQQIFRFDRFGDEQLWTDILRLHEVLPSVTPATALTVAGLKVDSDALPPPVIAAIKAQQLPVNDPRVTLRLLEMNAVVGVVGKVADDKLVSVGLTCALCHSTVDDSLAPGIGKRLDGWPNRDLNVGVIVGLSPSPIIDPFRQEFGQWGPGKYDARHHIFDGTNLTVLHGPTPTGRETIPVVIPPAFGLQGVGFDVTAAHQESKWWRRFRRRASLVWKKSPDERTKSTRHAEVNMVAIWTTGCVPNVRLIQKSRRNRNAEGEVLRL